MINIGAGRTVKWTQDTYNLRVPAGKVLGNCTIFVSSPTQDHYHKMIELTSQARKAYEMMVSNLEESVQKEPGEENETQQLMEPPLDTPEAEEPEYSKI